jgi:hypothetical protein
MIMIIARTTIQTSVFALCIGAFFIHPAQATEPELAFHPAQAWKVASGTGETCTLANNFNNGFELQMSGARGAIESLTIDFQQPAFEKDSSHEVTLSVPGGANATLQGRAANEQLLVVSLGNERDSLFNSMREAAVLDVATEGNEFRFYLTGFSDATARFDQCASGNAPVKAAAAAPQPTTIELPLEDLESTESAAQSVTEKEGIVEITEIVPPLPEPEIREEYQPSPPTSVEQEPMKRPVPPQHQRYTEKLQEEISEKYKAPEPAEYMKPYLEEAPEGKEITAVEKIVAAKEASKTLQAEPLKGDDMIAAAKESEQAEPAKQAEKTAAKAPESISWNKTPPKTVNVKTPDAVVSREAARMEADLTGAYVPDEPVPAKEAQRRPFEQKLEKIEPASSDISYRDETHRDDVADMAQKISELESTVHKLKTENAMLDSDLKGALQSSQEERVTISSDNWNLERATMRYNEAERQIQRLGQQLQRERAECTTEKQGLEGLLFDPEVTSQQQLAKLSELESKLEQAESELDAQRRRYEEQIKILEGRLNSN